MNSSSNNSTNPEHDEEDEFFEANEYISSPDAKRLSAMHQVTLIRDKDATTVVTSPSASTSTEGIISGEGFSPPNMDRVPSVYFPQESSDPSSGLPAGKCSNPETISTLPKIPEGTTNIPVGNGTSGEEKSHHGEECFGKQSNHPSLPAVPKEIRENPKSQAFSCRYPFSQKASELSIDTLERQAIEREQNGIQDSPGDVVVDDPTQTQTKKQFFPKLSTAIIGPGPTAGQHAETSVSVSANAPETPRDSNGPNSNAVFRVMVRVRSKRCDVNEITNLSHTQSLHVHHGPIWCLKVSFDGCFIATAGQDSIVRVWILDAAFRAELRTPTAQNATKPPDFSVFSPTASRIPTSPSFASSIARIVNPTPYREFSGHTADVIDLSWSQTNFILSASVDKTVRLWHVSRGQCLSVFSHPDMVTSVSFHPLEDRHFISGCFDKKVRMWDIPDHRVIEWKQTSHIVTAVQFTPQGTLVVAGLYDGTCVLFNTSGLRYHTQIECRNHRGTYSNGRKVTGLEFDRRGEHMLVTTNDNRIRIYSLTDYSCRAKFKGLDNESLQIRASWNEESQSIICGSDSENVYCWNIPPVCITNAPTSSDSNSSNKVIKVSAYEYFPAGKRTITCAQFLPRNSRRMAYEDAPNHLALVRNLLISTDMRGSINIYESQWPPS